MILGPDFYSRGHGAADDFDLQGRHRDDLEGQVLGHRRSQSHRRPLRPHHDLLRQRRPDRAHLVQVRHPLRRQGHGRLNHRRTSRKIRRGLTHEVSYAYFTTQIQSTTKTTEFFVVGILSVILVEFAILVATKSLGGGTV